MLRLSGPAVADILERTITGDIPPRAVTAARLQLDNHHALPVLIARYAAPASYTAQDSLEIQLPGNPRLIERIIEVLIAAGARQAEPGEFSARAYLNGQLTLDEGEGVGAMIAARNATQLRTARRLLSGQSAREYGEWTEALANLLALVEAGIDFTDQEGVVAISPQDLADRVEELTRAIESKLSASHQSTITTQPLVALVGEPNAGKSTLFNALLARPRSITSDEPATTRDAIIEPLDLSAHGGPQILLADLPGLDLDPRGEAETQAQASARAAIDRADAIVLCDPAGRFAGVCKDWIRDDRPTLRVRTKADLPGASTAGLGVCALDSWNLDSLRLALAEMAAGLDSAESDLVPRHRRVLGLAHANLVAARAIALRSDSLLSDAELIASELRLALDLLGELSGRITPDDVIGRVFSSFCVGK